MIDEIKTKLVFIAIVDSRLCIVAVKVQDTAGTALLNLVV